MRMANPAEASLGDLAGALASTGGLSLGWGQLDDNLNMAVILSALKETKNANILSTPSLLTLDNQEAFITVGQNVPFVTGSFTNSGGGDGAQNPFQTIERENVGITLTVTPHINEGDAIVLDIEQEVSSLSGLSVTQTASDIITNERKIQTKVLAVDGRVVVLGGLIKDDVQDAQQKVPLLGDIPYLGRLFRSDGGEGDKIQFDGVHTHHDYPRQPAAGRRQRPEVPLHSRPAGAAQGEGADVSGRCQPAGAV